MIGFLAGIATSLIAAGVCAAAWLFAEDRRNAKYADDELAIARARRRAKLDHKSGAWR